MNLVSVGQQQRVAAEKRRVPDGRQPPPTTRRPLISVPARVGRSGPNSRSPPPDAKKRATRIVVKDCIERRLSTMFVEPQPFARRHTSQVDTDAAIRLTDTDAVLARYSAVQKGYIHDPFVKPLLPRGAQFQPARPPLINVGTYVRSEGIDSLVNQWLALSRQEGKKCQIVSLGAGSDSRFWRIAVGVSSRGNRTLQLTGAGV